MNIIEQPRWKKVEYSRNQIIKAGKTIKKDCTPEEKEFALKVIDNWRAAHAYPLHVFYIHLKNMAASNQGIIVAQRLKRLDSIVDKLKREPSMSLWTIQDLGGCRFIVNSIESVYKYYNQYKTSRVRHKFIKEYDYIQNPKPSGYRSLHVVYEFHSDSNEDYNKNMLIEIQFRTHLQHLWATAVETMGIFTKQAIKSGKGSTDIKRFFALTSSLLAIKEEMPIVPNTPTEIDKIVNEIKILNSNYNYLAFLNSIKVITKYRETTISYKGKNDYCILSLNYDKHILNVYQFKSSEFDQANNYYNMLENQNNNNKTDTVLIRVSSFTELQSAYPNYFFDISEFINIINEYLE